MPTAKLKPISIGNPQTGISDSPLYSTKSAWYDLRNVNIDNMPGVAQINFRLNRQTKLAYSTSFTVNVSSNVIVFTDDTTTTGVANGIETVQFTTTGSLPAGLSLSTNYWLNGSYPGKVYSSWNNALNNNPITLTSATGSGTQTLTYQTISGTVHLYYEPTNNYLFAITSTGQVWLSINNKQFGLITGNSLTSYDSMIYWKGYFWFVGSGGIEVNKMTGDPSAGFAPVINSTYGYLPIADSRWQGAYSGTNTYTVGQVISYSGVYYQCIQATTAGTAPSNTAYWNPVVIWDTTYPKKCFIYQDYNQLYITNGLNLIQIKENLNQTLVTSALSTWNYNYGVLNAPMPSYATCLSEYNGLMYIGTNDKYIYTWNGIDTNISSGTTLAEKYTYWMVNSNNTLYIGAGTNGTIYYSNGVSSETIKTIPSHLYDKYYTTSTSPLLFSEAVLIKDSIVYPISFSGGTGAIFSYNTISGVLSIFNEVANIHYPTSNNYTLNFSSIVAINSIDYFVGYQYKTFTSTTTYSIDSNVQRTTAQRIIGNGTLYNPYFATLISGSVKCGIKTNKRTFEFIDVELGDCLSLGQGIAQYWRENLSDTFTLLADINDGGATNYSPNPTSVNNLLYSHEFNFSVPVESLQTKTVLYSQASDGQITTSPKFKIITIY